MHLVDVATRMQLASTGQVAACVPFQYKKKQKMTLYKGAFPKVPQSDPIHPQSTPK